MRRLYPTFVFLLMIFSAAAASPQALPKTKISATLSLADAGSWKPVQKGMEFRRIALERAESGQVIEIKALRLDTQRFRPRILLSARFQLKGASARTFAAKSGAVAAINASYFDTDGKPLGFLKADGQPYNPRLAKSALYSGLFAIKDNRPFILHRDDFLPEHADEGLQSGPLLLLRGGVQSLSGVGTRASRRALIGIDREQRLMIAVADSVIGGLYWAEIQELFAAPQWQLQAPDLLNLDGGGSAQLYVKAGSFEEFVPGAVEVPVAIGFFLNVHESNSPSNMKSRLRTEGRD